VSPLDGIIPIAEQMLDSPLASSRIYWRAQFGFPPDVVNDPRTLDEILGPWPLEDDKIEQ
jgi:hypothetical protein